MTSISCQVAKAEAQVAHLVTQYAIRFGRITQESRDVPYARAPLRLLLNGGGGGGGSGGTG